MGPPVCSLEVYVNKLEVELGNYDNFNLNHLDNKDSLPFFTGLIVTIKTHRHFSETWTGGAGSHINIY